MNDLILYGSIVLLGAVISFLCWQIFNFIDSVPDENRNYFDKPPFIFFILWTPIKVVSFYIELFLSQKVQDKLMQKIIYAGYDYVFKRWSHMFEQLKAYL